jgi:hypothetical protein
MFPVPHSPSGVTNTINTSLSITIATLCAVLQIYIKPYYFQPMILWQRKQTNTSQEILEPHYLQRLLW